MNLSRPYAAICPTLDSDVLNVLARTSRPLTGREVSRLVGRSSHGGVREVLNRLTREGIVDREEAGRAFMYTLNREHLAAPAVVVLAGMKSELARRLRHAVENWILSPTAALMFGSAARGDGDTASDIDILIIRPKGVDDEDGIWRRQLGDLSRSVSRWTGNRASIAEVAEKELARLLEENAPIVSDLQQDSVPFYGTETLAMIGVGP